MNQTPVKVRRKFDETLSFKSLNERTLGQRVALSRVKAMNAQEARARFTDPADQLLSGTEIELMGQLTQAINRIESHVLSVAGKWSTYLRLQEPPGIEKILGLTIALETGDAKRFAGAGNFANCCRCVKVCGRATAKGKARTTANAGTPIWRGPFPAPGFWAGGRTSQLDGGGGSSRRNWAKRNSSTCS